MSNSDLHVVFGAGQIGSELIDRLLKRGHRVRSVRRSPASSRHELHEVVQADVYDLNAALRAANGATVVYHCANAPYHQWKEQLPPLYRNIASAAKAANARLIVLDNVYSVGATGSFDEATPERPCSRKGMIRKQLSDELREMHAKKELSVTLGRASDFFGAGGDNSALLHPRSMAQLLKGEVVDVLVNIDRPHSWSYPADVAEGLLQLGLHPELSGQTLHLPVLPPQTGRAMLTALAAELGQTLKVRQMPGWLLRVLGWFNPVMGEFPEMMYQFENPFVMSDERIRRLLSIEPTPWATQISETAQWIQQTVKK